MAKKVLLVDDDVDSLKLGESILKSEGYEVLTLNYPKFALKTIKEERPDVVVLDIIMPFTDGYALCEEIKKVFLNKVPVVLCTAKSYEQDFIENACKDFGAEAFLIKPFKKEELLKTIKSIIEKSPQQNNAST